MSANPQNDQTPPTEQPPEPFTDRMQRYWDSLRAKVQSWFEPKPKEAAPAAPAREGLPEPVSTTAPRQSRNWFAWNKVLPAFWTIAALLSMVVNVILIALLIGLGREIFTIRSMVGDQLLGGLYTNFQKMDSAHIKTTIEVAETIMVEDSILVKFDLPLNQDTTVVLVDDTPVDNTTIYLNGVAVPVNIVLPKGTELGISLDLTVPVETTVPVNLEVPVQLTVPVDIPLNETELHEPFTGLQGVVGPYYQMTSDLPATWEDTSICGPGTGWFCRWFFGQK